MSHQHALPITLGGVTFKVPKFNLGQHERMVDAKAFEVLRIALERADPPIADPNAIEASFPEIKAAVAAIMEFSGYKSPDPNV
jgi:hypothetical protein